MLAFLVESELCLMILGFGSELEAYVWILKHQNALSMWTDFLFIRIPFLSYFYKQKIQLVEILNNPPERIDSIIQPILDGQLTSAQFHDAILYLPEAVTVVAICIEVSFFFLFFFTYK